LYYGCLRDTPYRWLDLHALSRALLPRDEIHRIRYFTALVSARPGDPQQAQRQQVYLRALGTMGVINPHPASHRSRALKPTFFKQLRPAALRASPFPPVLRDAVGEIRKPARW
jgi:hypothetical protein